VKLDPEERIIGAALGQAERDDANERGADARIEFNREGDAKVTITISRELVAQARALDLTTGELFAEAIRLAVPGVFDLAGPHPPRSHWRISRLGPGQFATNSVKEPMTELTDPELRRWHGKIVVGILAAGSAVFALMFWVTVWGTFR
jgi:hypothetical protein